jgi:diguanylate cyclase (GGDEF)-like protein
MALADLIQQTLARPAVTGLAQLRARTSALPGLEARAPDRPEPASRAPAFAPAEVPSQPSSPAAPDAAEAHAAGLRAYQSAPAPKAAAPALAPRDTISFLGIPPQELTPAVRGALERLVGEIDLLRGQQAQLRERLEEAQGLADIDPLAQVLNRRGFVREMQRTMAFADRTGVATSVLFFDLNGFKQINDRFGHPAGDAMLKGVATTLREHVRGSDVVGRLGGDEFAVLLAKAGPEEARRKGAQLADAVRATIVPHGTERLRIGTAVGAYTIQRGDTPELAISRADEAMYLDKSGRRVVSL